MAIDFESISELIFDISTKIESHLGLSIFASERAKFEGWLKVELCDILSNRFQDVAPEKDRVDITFDGWAIELKTVNTNYRYENAENKHRPITKNIEGVISDIEKLQSLNYTNKAVVFLVFPLEHDNSHWQEHLKKVHDLLKELKWKEFKFKNGVSGVIYFGLV